MKLPRVVESLDSVEEPHRSLYEERDGKFHLVIEVDPSDDDRKRVAEAARREREGRDAAEKRAREAEDRAKQFEGLDIERIRELLAREEEHAQEHARETGQFEKLYNQERERRVENEKKIRTEYDAIVAAKDATIEDLIVTKDLNDALTAAGIHPDLREGAFALLRPKIRMRTANGSAPHAAFEVDDRDVAVPDYVKMWSTTEGAPYKLAPENLGGDASGSRDKARREPNPYKRDTLNLTRQGALERENPEMAARFKAEAGVR